MPRVVFPACASPSPVLRATRSVAGAWLGVLLVGLVPLVLIAGGRAVDRSAPSLMIRSWSTGQGLPENSATSIAQSPDGDLWLGTFGGLARFNGQSFTTFTPRNTPALPSAGIVNLHLDRAGRLWISAYLGLVVRDDTGWRRIEGWTGDFVRTFTERPGEEMLLTSFDGKVFEARGERVVELPPPPGEAGRGYLGGVDEAGRWWVAQNAFIGCWEDGRWIRKLLGNRAPRDAVGLGQARGGGLWLWLDRELIRLRDGQPAATVALDGRVGGFWSLMEDQAGQVWITTYDEGFVRVTADGAMTRWNAGNGASDNGRFVFEDREGTLWMGTSGDGLLQARPRRLHHLPVAGGARGIVVQSVTADSTSGILAATYGQGLMRVEAGGTAPVAFPGLVDDTPYLQSVLRDRVGRLWVGTLDRGLRMSTSGGAWRVPNEAIGGGNVLASFEDSRGRIWFSTGGAEVACFEEGTFRRFAPAGGAAGRRFACFAEDRTGAIWTADSLGVFRRRGDGPFEEVMDARGQSVLEVRCLLAEGDGGMWMGTADRGLLRWHDGDWTVFDGANGLPLTDLRNLIKDRDGNLWMTSARQLARVTPADLRALREPEGARPPIPVFDQGDGLPEADFIAGRQPACALDAEGTLWFATTRGLARLDPAALKLNAVPPPVRIERLSFHQPMARGAIRQGETTVRIEQTGPFDQPVTLPPGSHRLEINFAVLSLAAPEKVRAEVMLEGRDAAWHEPTTARTAFFHDLRPGRYLFRVRAANNDGIWNLDGASLPLVIQPHLWQTAWFQAVTACGLVGLGGAGVWAFARGRLRRAAERERVTRQIQDLAGRLIHAQENERHRLARELHDDFSQRLALLSVELELLGGESGRRSANETPQVEQLAAQVKELSSDVHRMAYALHPAKLDQLGLVAAARGLCREVTQQSGLRIDFAPGEVPRELHPDVALCFYRVLQESLGNIVRHGGTGAAARVELRVAGERVCLTVSDTGSGFDLAAAHRAGRLGLSSMEERARLVGGTLTIESSPGKGTRVEVCAPARPGGRSSARHLEP